jgi:hypothetical protein
MSCGFLNLKCILWFGQVGEEPKQCVKEFTRCVNSDGVATSTSTEHSPSKRDLSGKADEAKQRIMQQASQVHPLTSTMFHKRCLEGCLCSLGVDMPEKMRQSSCFLLVQVNTETGTALLAQLHAERMVRLASRAGSQQSTHTVPATELAAAASIAEKLPHIQSDIQSHSQLDRDADAFKLSRIIPHSSANAAGEHVPDKEHERPPVSLLTYNVW